MSLKEKARSRSGSSSSSLASKSKSRADDGGVPKDPIVKPDPVEPSPNIDSGMPYDAPPPLPPAFLYLRMLATIPGLRKRVGGGV